MDTLYKSLQGAFPNPDSDDFECFVDGNIRYALITHADDFIDRSMLQGQNYMIGIFREVSVYLRKD